MKSVVRHQVLETPTQGPKTPYRDNISFTPSSEKLNGRNLEGEFEDGKSDELNQNQNHYQNSKPDGKHNGNERETVSIARFTSACVAVRAAVSMASQPSLRRLMMAGGGGGGGGEEQYLLSWNMRPV